MNADENHKYPQAWPCENRDGRRWTQMKNQKQEEMQYSEASIDADDRIYKI